VVSQELPGYLGKGVGHNNRGGHLSLPGPRRNCSPWTGCLQHQLGLASGHSGRWIDAASPYRTNYTFVTSDRFGLLDDVWAISPAGRVTYETDWLNQEMFPGDESQ